MKKKVLIVTASYYWDITGSLRAEAELLLEDAKIKFDVIDVPGVFEIPVTIAKNIKKYDGFIALGCVIKGETDHYDYICSSVSQGIMQLNLTSSIPIIFCILTDHNKQQSIDRSGGKYGNKGVECAFAALQMLSFK